MRLKLDENLPEALIQILSTLGHDVDNTRLEGVAGKDDETVWKAAQEGGRFFITQDLDFSDLRRFKPGTHHGLLLVRLRAPGRLALASCIREAFVTHGVDSWLRCFVLLTDHKLRVHAPEP
jgi:predicted nuclease of predicted toxin-antitoxin system